MKQRFFFLFPFLSIILLFFCFCSPGKGGETAVPSPETVLPAEEKKILSDEELLKDLSLKDFSPEGIKKIFAEKKGVEALHLRASIDTSLSTINYFKVENFDTSRLVSGDNAGALEIVDYGPRGELPIEMRKPSIFVLFNQPMVPVSKLGEPLKKSPIMSLAPEVKGIFRWYGTKLLSFEPDKPMHQNREYEVTIHQGSASIFKKSLEEDFSFIFHGESLKMISLLFGSLDEPFSSKMEVPPDKAGSVIITFNQTVEPEILKGSFQVEAGDKAFSYTLSPVPEPEDKGVYNTHFLARSVLLRVKEKLPFESRVTITLQAGARADAESSSRDTPQALAYNTLQPFTFNSMGNWRYGFPQAPEGVKNPVYVYFSHPLDASSLEVNLLNSFGIPMKLDKQIRVSDRVVELANLPVTYESEYYVTIKEGVKDIYGRSLGTEYRKKVVVPPADNYAQFPGWDGLCSLEAEAPPLLIYEFQNIDEGTFTVNGDILTPDFTKALRNEANFVPVDLAPYLNEQGTGRLSLSWNFIERYKSYGGDEIRKREITRDMDLQVTDMAITLRQAYNKLIIWVSKISSGENLPGARVIVLDKNGRTWKEGETDSQGLLLLDIPPGAYNTLFLDSKKNFIMTIRAEKEEDRTELPVRYYYSAGRFGIPVSSPSLATDSVPRIFLFSDRGLYRPGETLTFRGIDWNQTLGDFAPYQGEYTITIRDGNGYEGKEIQTLQGTTSASGGFFHTFEIPQDAEPGFYRIQYTRPGSKYPDLTQNFQVAFFRRLNFQVALAPPRRTYFLGDKIAIPLTASYLAGGNLGEGKISYFWTRRPVNFVPPGERWRNWRFGPPGWGGEKHLTSGSGRLNLSGRSSLEITTSGHEIAGKAYRYVVEATVKDIDRQSISASSSVIVHPASRYIGARIDTGVNGWWSHFVALGEEVPISLTLVDLEGEVVPDLEKVKVEITREHYKAVQQKGVAGRITTRYNLVPDPVQEKEVTLSRGEGRFSFKPEEGGSYKLIITGEDPEGREMVTAFSFYVTGGKWIYYAGRNDNDIDLELDRDLYFPGDTARLLVRSPVEKGTYLLTVEREGILEEKLVEIGPSNTLLEIPILESYVPVMYVTLTSFRNRSANPSSYFEPDFSKPKGLFGAVKLPISSRSRELDFEVATDKSLYRPGEKAEVTIKVTRGGIPVSGAEVTYLAVDRGVLDIINYHVPNPLEFFYDPSHFPLYTSGDDSRRLLLAPVTYDITNLTGGDGDESKLPRREVFTPLAVFKPYLTTDDRGEVKVEVQWPDTLTTYRSTVIALSGQNLGYTEKEIQVRNPINVRTALPREMRSRDTAYAGVVLNNIDSSEHEVTVKISSDILGLPGEKEKTVTLPAGAVYEVPFILEGKEPGEGTVLFTILSDVLNEELVETMEVSTPLIKEAFTTNGIIDKDEVIKEEGLIVPRAINDSYGSLEFSLDSSQVPYLQVPLLSLRNTIYYGDIFTAAYAAVPGILLPDLGPEIMGLTASNLSAPREFYLKLTSQLQNRDGGIVYSYNSLLHSPVRSSPYGSLLCAHLMTLMEKQKMSISRGPDYRKLMNYLDKQSLKMEEDLYFAVYLNYIHALAGEYDKERTGKLLAFEDQLGISGYALLGYSYILMGEPGEAKKIYHRIRNFVQVGTKGVDVVETYETRYYFDSGYQQIAHLLNLGLQVKENSTITGKYAYSLNSSRNYRHWSSPQDRFWSSIALTRLIETGNVMSTNYTAAVKLNNTELFSRDFKGLSRKPQEKEFSLFREIVPMVERDSLNSLVFEKKGKGQLYYSSTIRYALPSEVALPRDEGLEISSHIETLDGAIVEDNILEAGETYRMRVFVMTSRSRSFLRLTVPVPSGCDIVDPSFDISSSYFNRGGTGEETWTRETQYGDEEQYTGEGYIGGGWIYSLSADQLIYNTMVRYNWRSLYRGQREVSFLFRATTPGVYPTPPASGDLLFEPEVFGRGKGQIFVIH